MQDVIHHRLIRHFRHAHTLHSPTYKTQDMHQAENRWNTYCTCGACKRDSTQHIKPRALQLFCWVLAPVGRMSLFRNPGIPRFVAIVVGVVAQCFRLGGAATRRWGFWGCYSCWGGFGLLFLLGRFWQEIFGPCAVVERRHCPPQPTPETAGGHKGLGARAPPTNIMLLCS